MLGLPPHGEVLPDSPLLRRACQPVHVSTFLSWDQKWMRAAHFLDMFAAEVFHLEATAVDRHWFSLPRRGLKALCGKFSGLRLTVKLWWPQPLDRRVSGCSNCSLGQLTCAQLQCNLSLPPCFLSTFAWFRRSKLLAGCKALFLTSPNQS